MNILLLLLAIAAPLNDDLPPSRYQGNAKPTIVVTVDDTNTKAACGVAQPGWVLMGCEFDTKKGPTIIISNPCNWPETRDKETFAHLMCHEFGHVNGWSVDHSK